VIFDEPLAGIVGFEFNIIAFSGGDGDNIVFEYARVVQRLAVDSRDFKFMPVQVNVMRQEACVFVKILFKNILECDYVEVVSNEGDI